MKKAFSNLLWYHPETNTSLQKKIYIYRNGIFYTFPALNLISVMRARQREKLVK